MCVTWSPVTDCMGVMTLLCSINLWDSEVCNTRLEPPDGISWLLPSGSLLAAGVLEASAASHMFPLQSHTLLNRGSYLVYLLNLSLHPGPSCMR
jgi:hypothetical protein